MTALDDIGGLIPWDALQRWILEHDDELPGEGPVLEALPLQGGAQNVILRLRRQGGELVLRRPPPHLRANSNETMSREARVLGALSGTGVPHPALYASCDDPAVIGASFYVMESIDGFTPLGALPDQYVPEWRRAMAFELVDAAARLGAVDPAAVGLGDFGRSEGWASRQVDRWWGQLEGYAELGYRPAVDVAPVGEWLRANLPAETRIGIIHGDLQWANTMFSRTRAALLAIVDWELSTLGDPLLDLGWILTSWIDEDDPPGHTAQLTPTEGLPTRQELIERYAQASGRDLGDMDWYFTLACYKLGILLEGTYARALAGKAPMAMGEMLHDYALWVFAKAGQLVDGVRR